MRPIIWIVSYPRSGNTYIRALLANYLSAEPRALSLDELAHSTSGEHNEPLWQALTARPPAERTLAIEWAARPSYIEALRRQPGSGPVLVKSHTINGEIYGQKAFDFQVGDRVVHIIRHPADVAISCADFYGISLETSVERMLTPGHLIDGRPQYGFEVTGSWEQHTRSWLAETRIPVHRLRYFEAVEDPVATLGALIAFLQFGLDANRLRDAARFSDFQVLRAQEEAHKFVEASSTAVSGRFFRVGRARQWLDSLSPELAARVIEPNQSLIRELGFAEFDPHAHHRVATGG